MNPEHEFALSYARADVRPALEALWRLDATLGAVLATGSQAPQGTKMVSRIRLAWWREALERLDGFPPPAEPVLEGLAEYVLPHVTGADLARMEAGWVVLTDPPPLPDVELMAYAKGRGLLFGMAAELLAREALPLVGRVGWGREPLGSPTKTLQPLDESLSAADAAGAPTPPSPQGGGLMRVEALAAAGRVFAFADLARRTRNRQEVERIAALAPVGDLPSRWPWALRPLGMMSALAARDLARPPERWEPLNAPPRRARMLRMLLTGW